MHRYQLRKIASQSFSLLAVVFLLFGQIVTVQAQEEVPATPTAAVIVEVTDIPAEGETPSAEPTLEETLTDTPVPERPTETPTAEVTPIETQTPLPEESPTAASAFSPLETTLDAYPENPSNSASASFSFSSTNNTITFECSLDGNIYEPCSSPAAYEELAEGAHTFAVQAMDLAGNLDETPAFYSWEIVMDQNLDLLAADSGFWEMTGSMNNARLAHTATLLRNGNVLVTGGNSSSGTIASAELYNPQKGVWTNTASMSTARAEASAILLPNKKVLVAGGHNGDTIFNNAEIYDPLTGTWADTGSMINARYAFNAILLSNGEVLVAGGVGTGGVFLSSAELYDPTTESWTATGSLNTSRASIATLLSSGNVLMAGGENASGFLTSAELYDPTNGIWTPTSPSNTFHHYHLGLLFPDGQVLLVGAPQTPSVELYNPNTGTWTITGSMNEVRRGGIATLLADGNVLAAGGSIYYGPGTSTGAELYNKETGTWTPIDPMNVSRGGPGVLLPDGNVLALGYDNYGGTTELYVINDQLPVVRIEQGSTQADPASATPIVFDVTFSEEVTGFESSDVDFTGSTAPGILSASISGAGTSYTISVTGMTGSGTVVVSIPAGSVHDLAGKANLDSISEDDSITYNFTEPEGEWVITGSLNHVRQAHTATLLKNGKVLVAGGHYGDNIYSSAELFDPIKGIWSLVEPMNIARVQHIAVRLTDGKVLVAGGNSGSASLASAELYDPDTGFWTNTGSMNFGRYGFPAILLPNGKVLVAGGWDFVNNRGQNTAEVYDPSTGIWTLTGSMNYPNGISKAILLQNEKVLVAGGWDNELRRVNNAAELYDQISGVWTNAHPMNFSRGDASATLLLDGHVLIAGTPDTSSAELYDPISDTWATTGSMHVARRAFPATLLPDGKVLAPGGNRFGGPAKISDVDLYNPLTGTWSVIDSMNIAREWHTATMISNGNVLVAGGDNSLGSVELYTLANSLPVVELEQARGQVDPASASPVVFDVTFSEKVTGFESSDVDFTGSTAPGTLSAAVSGSGTAYTISVSGMTGSGTVVASIPAGSVQSVAGNSNLDSISEDNSVTFNSPGEMGLWSTTGSLADARWSYAIVRLRSGKVLITGGYDGSSVLASAEIFDPDSGTWASTGSMNTARYVHTATLLPDGKVLAAGGIGADMTTTSSSELYDPVSGTWNPTDSMITPRSDFAAALLPDGKVFVAGGFNGSSAVTSAEIFDPDTKSWTSTGPMNNARHVHTATRLPNGKVLVVGGEGIGGFLANAEIYDPVSGLWTFTSPPNSAHCYHKAVLLFNGDVLVAGAPTTPSVEIYDPQTDTWTAMASMYVARRNGIAAILPDGNVLVAGGNISGTLGATAQAEIYQQDANIWYVTDSMEDNRELLTAVTLPDGKILASAGNHSDNYDGELSSAELFSYSSPAPVVTLNQAPSQADPTNTGPVVFNVMFSEEVTGFESSDLDFTGSTAPGNLTASISGSDTSYTISVTGMTGSGSVIVSIPAGSIQDAAGNYNLDSISTDNIITYDINPPETVIDSKPDDTTNSASASYTFSSTDITAAFECSLDASAYETCISPKTYTDLTEKSHTFAVRAKDPAGNVDETPAAHVWTIYLTPPSTATLVSPNSRIPSSIPAYTWNAVSNSTAYLLWVHNIDGFLFADWYSAADTGCSSGTGTCSISPSNTLPAGAYSWWIQTWNSAGDGEWSDQMDFLVGTGNIPAAATQVSPTGQISDSTPTYTWNARSGTTWYYLWVDNLEGYVFAEWYSAADAGCGGGTGTCSITPSVTLNPGMHKWYIQTFNSYGYGEWSSGLSFQLGAGAPPPPPTLVSPSGSTSDTTPTYTWNANNSTWYWLWVEGPAGKVMDQWYTAAEAGCSGGTGTCSVTPTNTLAKGAHQWWILGFNPFGWGEWGAEMNFTVE